LGKAYTYLRDVRSTLIERRHPQKVDGERKRFDH